jgi:hypothetical protein
VLLGLAHAVDAWSYDMVCANQAPARWTSAPCTCTAGMQRLCTAADATCCHKLLLQQGMRRLVYVCSVTLCDCVAAGFCCSFVFPWSFIIHAAWRQQSACHVYLCASVTGCKYAGLAAQY